MKLLTLTKIKINLTWQILFEVSKSQQDRSMWRWSDNTNCNQWSWTPSLSLAHGLPEYPPTGLVIWALWGERCLLGRSFPCCAGNPEAHGMCTGRSGVWLHLTLTARPAPGHAQERIALGGHLMSTLWMYNLCTLYCQVPYLHGGACASELITCDWSKYFMQYFFLARILFGSAVWDVKPLTLQT